jgi:hypothetical protein
MSTLAISCSGAAYDAAKYIPAADVVTQGLGPGVTHQARLGWVVWSRPDHRGEGLDVRPATEAEIAAHLAERRASLEQRRRIDVDGLMEEEATHQYTAHMWIDTLPTDHPARALLAPPMEPPYVMSRDGAIGVISLVG